MNSQSAGTQKKEDEAPQSLDLFDLLGTGPSDPQPAETTQSAYNPPDLLSNFMSMPAAQPDDGKATNTSMSDKNNSSAKKGETQEAAASKTSMFAFMSVR